MPRPPRRTRIELRLHAPSTHAIPAIRGLADALGGFVLDARWFGNALLTAEIDTTEGDLDGAADAARALGMRPTGPLPQAEGPPDRDALLVVALRCVHDEGDAIRDVPAVPG